MAFVCSFLRVLILATVGNEQPRDRKLAGDYSQRKKIKNSSLISS